MKSFLSAVLSAFTSLRSVFFIVLFLLIGNYHQAVEKQPDGRPIEEELSWYLTPKIQFNPDYQSYIERSIDNLLKRRGFNGSLLLAHQGEAVYNKSRGHARFHGKTPFAPENNVFQLASAGKQFTAFSMLMLHEKGLVELDDKVCDYILEFPYPDITIRHLLNHTSGLQNYFYIIDNYWKEVRLPVHQDMLDLMIDHSLSLNFTPGSRFSYSNTGYAFLAMLVERISGESFADFIHNNIFTPLNMENSFVYHPGVDLDDIATRTSLAKGHERAGRWLREMPVDYNDGITGDKGIFSTTEDLLKWDNALENNLLVSEETKALAFENGQLRSGYKVNYGFGFRIKNKRNENIIYHNGWWKGYRTAYVRLPENTLLVVLNNTTASISGLEDQIIRIVNSSPFPMFEENNKILAMQYNPWGENPS